MWVTFGKAGIGNMIVRIPRIYAHCFVEVTCPKCQKKDDYFFLILNFNPKKPQEIVCNYCVYTMHLDVTGNASGGFNAKFAKGDQG